MSPWYYLKGQREAYNANVKSLAIKHQFIVLRNESEQRPADETTAPALKYYLLLTKLGHLASAAKVA